MWSECSRRWTAATLSRELAVGILGHIFFQVKEVRLKAIRHWHNSRAAEVKCRMLLHYNPIPISLSALLLSCDTLLFLSRPCKSFHLRRCHRGGLPLGSNQTVLSGGALQGTTRGKLTPMERTSPRRERVLIYILISDSAR